MSRPRTILSLALLAYQAVFLNVVLPGHARGAVTLDGRHSPAACCCSGPSDRQAADRGPAEPSRRDKDRCAVCQFMLGLTSVPAVAMTLPDRGLLELLPVPPPAVAVARDLIPTYYGNGPPPAVA